MTIISSFKQPIHPLAVEICQTCKQQLTPGRRKYCAECAPNAKRERNHQWHIDNKDRRKKNDNRTHKSPSHRWHVLKSNAKRRGLDVSLTRDQYEEISKQPCYYCDGILDTDIGHGSHIDRLNNQFGYSFENSISCCNFCNRIKQDLLTPEETRAVIKLIIRMRINNGNDSFPPNSSTCSEDMPSSDAA